MEHEAEASYLFEFSKAEHVRACRAIHRHAIHRRWIRFLLTATYLLLAGAVVITLLSGRVERQMIPSMLPIFVLLALGPLAVTLSAYIQARQWEKLNPPWHRQVTIAITGDAFRSESYVGSNAVKWAAVKQIVETKEFLLIYMTDKIAHYLPKRAIPGGELAHVKRLLASRVHSPHVHLMRPDSAR